MSSSILEMVYLGNRIADYLTFVGLFLAAFVMINIFQRVILRRLKKWVEKTANTIDDFFLEIIQRLILPLAYFGVFYVAVNILNLHPFLNRAIDVIGMAVLMICTARLVVSFMGYGFKLYFAKRGKDTESDRSLTGVLAVLRIIVWALAIVVFLDNMGFKISAIIAGLGIGGIAIALAAQAVLGDLFSYFSILFDRPFEVGDFIILDEYLGTIEHIGIKTTRIRSLGGELVILSNTDLTSSRVRNYKRMEQRRVVFKLGVTYQTSLEQLKVMPGIIEKVIKDVKDATFDRAHFFSYGDFSLVFEVVYYVMSRDYNIYMDIQQEINFAIKKEFEDRDIEFAYPTQTLYLNK